MEPQSENRYIASTKKKTVNYDRLTVELTAVSKDPMDTYHEYTLNCRSSTLSWTIKRRYNSFVTLHQQSCELFPWLTGLAPRIQLPPTKWFGNRKDIFVDKRRKGLQTYLDELLKIPEISKSDIMALFLDPNRPTSEEGNSKVPLPMLKSLQIESHFTLNELMLLYSKTKSDNHKIGKDEFSRFVSELGITELNQVELLYGAFTHAGPEASFQDVVLGMSSFTRGTFLEKAKFAFKVYDTNNTGRITREALYSIVLSLDISALQGKDRTTEDKDLRPEERDSGQTRYFEVLVERLFRIMSPNNENEVTLEDFMKSCLASHQILAAIGIKAED